MFYMWDGFSKRVSGVSPKDDIWKRTRDTIIGIRWGGRLHVLCDLLPQDLAYPGMHGGGLPGNSEVCDTDEVSLWMETLGVAGDDPIEGIRTVPVMRALQYAYPLPVGVHIPTIHN